MGDAARQTEMLEELATRLFSALGYDGISIGEIAEAAGLDVAQVNNLIGDKQALYLAALRRLSRSSIEVLEKVLGAPTEDPEQSVLILHRAADHYLDFCLDNPDSVKMSLQRVLQDAGDVEDVERKYAHPHIQLIREALAPAVAAGYIDEENLIFLLWTMQWCVHAFCQGGILDENGTRTRTPIVVAGFRRYLHRLVDRTLTLPGDLRKGRLREKG
jgi:AcrR family transcriptional regulator